MSEDHPTWWASGSEALDSVASSQVLAQADVVNWLSARVAGDPAPSNC